MTCAISRTSLRWYIFQWPKPSYDNQYIWKYSWKKKIKCKCYGYLAVQNGKVRHKAKHIKLECFLISGYPWENQGMLTEVVAGLSPVLQHLNSPLHDWTHKWLGLSNNYCYCWFLWLFENTNYCIKGSEPPLFYEAKFILNNLRSLLALQITSSIC